MSVFSGVRRCRRATSEASRSGGRWEVAASFREGGAKEREDRARRWCRRWCGRVPSCCWGTRDHDRAGGVDRSAGTREPGASPRRARPFGGIRERVASAAGPLPGAGQVGALPPRRRLRRGGWRPWSGACAGGSRRRSSRSPVRIPACARHARSSSGTPKHSEDERRAFRRAGLAHLVAASGMNVALVVTAVALAAAFAGRRMRVVLFAVAILVYLLLVGPVPSLLRASVMTSVALAAVAFGRPPLPLHCLALASVGMLLVSPAMSVDVGFQLSCAATFGLVVGVPWLVERWRRGPRSLRTALATALAAQVATLPLSIPVFHALSPASIALNLVAVPLAAILLIAAFVWAGVALASPTLATLLAPALDLLAAPFRLLEAVPAGPWISLPATAAPAGGLIVAALLALIAAAPRVWRGPVALAVVLLGTNGVPSVDDSFELVVADVGQGEGMLLRHGRHALLVDGGGGGGRDLASEVWRPRLAARGLVGLDAVIATHSHADHCEGLVDVAVHVRIDRIFGPPSFPGSVCAGDLTRWSRREPTTLAAGNRIAFGGLVLEVLAPFPGRPSKGPNEDSLVLRVDGGGRRLLLTGDLDGAAERRLVDEAGRRLDADVLKVGHHGSSRGTGNALIAAVRPRVALISAGVRSRFGHPSAEAVERLERARVRIYRTDLSGELRVRWAPGGPLFVDQPAAPRRVSG
ncbi:MAG: DNA internalization-related competence protein ComEC/Rec2 [Thermoanaerobaculia bacterium]